MSVSDKRNEIVAPTVGGSASQFEVFDHHPSLAGALTRRLYFRSFGVVYLIAFLSLWGQIHGLIGRQGLLPADRFLHSVHERFGATAYRLLPSLCWFGSSDLMLHFWCGLGVLLTVILIIGWAPRLILILLWAIYLSLCAVGQDFLSFQWDTLLLEMTVCSWLYAPRGLRPDWSSSPRSIACWPLWGLTFKLMFLSGVTKLLSGDPSWIDGTALQFHDYTQPIPSWPAWYSFQLPLVIHRLALLVLFVVEVVLPFLIFVGRRGRAIFGFATISLMIGIEATGNFGFFNLQTIVLCIPLLNDDLLRRLIPHCLLISRSLSQSATDYPPARERWRNKAARFAVAALLSISFLAGVSEISSTARAGQMPRGIMIPIECADTLFLSWGKPWVLQPIASFRTINGYGLFRVMTTRRNEIVLEISSDGKTWTSCELPYKPGRIDRAPPIVAPHMPRLDWQMWFAALDLNGNQHWLAALMQRTLEGSPVVVRLLGHPELESNPPQFVRLAYYEYKFTDAGQKRATGDWWNRTFLGNLTGPMGK